MNKYLLILTSVFAWSTHSAFADEVDMYGETTQRLTSETPTYNLPSTSVSFDQGILQTGLYGTHSHSTDYAPQSLNSTAADFISPDNIQIEHTFEFANSDLSGGLSFSPRFTEFQSNNAGLESFSAEIRLGNVVRFDQGKDTNGWYIFAAADGEALSISTNSLSVRDGSPMDVSLTEQITIGDLQAGVSTYVGGTQLTFSYIETEASYSAPGGLSTSRRDSFAGFSLARAF